MSLTATLAAVAPVVSNEVLGKIAKAFDPDVLGATLRPLLGVFEPTVTAEAVTKSPDVPMNPTVTNALKESIYGAFGTYRRRTVAALARLTGLTPDAVVTLLRNNEDFRFSQGRDSDNTYVSLAPGFH